MFKNLTTGGLSHFINSLLFLKLVFDESDLKQLISRKLYIMKRDKNKYLSSHRIIKDHIQVCLIDLVTL